MDVLAGLALASLAGWTCVLLGTARAWDLKPIAEDEPLPPDPAAWPSVSVVVPARNEAAVLPLTLPALLDQDYPGAWHLTVVDDRSTDGTVEAARSLGTDPVPGTELPAGWVGKVWALEQGSKAAGEADYYLLTDADILHAPHSLRRLVAESEAGVLAMNSRMARLRCQAPAERLLIPPFLLFFSLLYPMRRVNDRRRRTAAAAGGCILLRHDALELIGGFGAIRDRVIDDVSLARAVKRLGEPIRLSVVRADVRSVRPHDLAAVWRMVRRTAFTQLRHSWALVGLTVGVLVLLFALPPALVAVSAAGGRLLPLAVSASAWTLMTAIYVPTVRYFGLSPVWVLTLPLAGCLYGAMTFDSGLRRRLVW